VICFIEKETGIRLKGLELTQTKLRISRRHKIHLTSVLTVGDRTEWMWKLAQNGCGS